MNSRSKIEILQEVPKDKHCTFEQWDVVIGDMDECGAVPFARCGNAFMCREHAEYVSAITGASFYRRGTRINREDVDE
jgi:hypothetical protein